MSSTKWSVANISLIKTEESSWMKEETGVEENEYLEAVFPRFIRAAKHMN